jgi:NAD(P)-dependent dehydrogenase (short-subunit alcohol dehydrogenase family)
MDISGIAAVVTGAGSGLGAATARALAKRGAMVAVLDISLDGASAVANEIGGLAFACDVTQESAADALDRAALVHGAARVLVNCAGIAPSGRTVGREGALPLAAYVKVINVNLIGTFNMLRLAAARMAKLDPISEERGVIINTASIAAYEGQIGQVAYASSKGGVVGMTLPAARDLASAAIRVNSIAPGMFMTPMLMTVSEEYRQSLAAQVPFPPRLGDPAEFAGLAVHIIENRMINGETIRLDGALRGAAVRKPARRPSSAASKSGGGLLAEKRLELTRLEHLGDDVAAADEFALHIELRDSRPVGVVFDALAQFTRVQNVDAFILGAEMIEDLHDAAGEAAHRHFRRAFHEQHHVIRFHFIVNPGLHVGHFWLALSNSLCVPHAALRPISRPASGRAGLSHQHMWFGGPKRQSPIIVLPLARDSHHNRSQSDRHDR